VIAMVRRERIDPLLGWFLVTTVLCCLRTRDLPGVNITASGTSPERTASTSAAPHGFSNCGMAMSSPPKAAPIVDRAARQSETTTPSKPHSPLRISSCRRPLADIGEPFTPL